MTWGVLREEAQVIFFIVSFIILPVFIHFSEGRDEFTADSSLAHSLFRRTG
jgi:hypothetical protein